MDSDFCLDDGWVLLFVRTPCNIVIRMKLAILISYDDIGGGDDDDDAMEDNDCSCASTIASR